MRDLYFPLQNAEGVASLVVRNTAPSESPSEVWIEDLAVLSPAQTPAP